MSNTKANERFTIEQKNFKIFESHTNERERTVRGVPGEMYGLEMEVYSGDGRWAVAAVANEGETEDFVDLEDDGSLSDANGIEMVSRGPKPVSKLLEDNGWLDRLMARITSRGGVRFGPQRNGYGLHINVNCAGWSWEEKTAFCAAIVLMPSVNKAVADREHNGSGDYNRPVAVWGGPPHAYDSYYVRRGGVTPGTGYRPYGYIDRTYNTYVRVGYNNLDCIECRIFRMNTDPAVIKGYIKHLQEIRAFSKKYKNILLYLSAATATFDTERPVLTGGFPAINDFLENLWNNRATTTVTQAAANLPAINQSYTRYHGEYFLAIFDSTKTFRQRTSALLSAWYTPQPAPIETSYSNYGGLVEDGDDDDYYDGEDDDYCCEECNGPRAEAA